MTLASRSPYELLTVFAGSVAGFIWASLGVRALVMDEGPSTRALFACAATVLVGFALGSVMWVLMEPQRRRRPAEAASRAEMRGAHTMLGVMAVGLGASAILEPSPGVWDWGLMVVAALAGGLNLGVSFMAIAAPPSASGSLAAARSEDRRP